MGGFKSVEWARRFCRLHDEVRNFLRPPLAAKRGDIARATADALHGQHPYPIDYVSGGINENIK